ncbi:UNVERIFIED_CONTAM: hypothetical protein GTU68_020408 [Idotea baltica]|nr:hypothetical protein [Idotea baltica]
MIVKIANSFPERRSSPTRSATASPSCSSTKPAIWMKTYERALAQATFFPQIRS